MRRGHAGNLRLLSRRRRLQEGPPDTPPGSHRLGRTTSTANALAAATRFQARGPADHPPGGSALVPSREDGGYPGGAGAGTEGRPGAGPGHVGAAGRGPGPRYLLILCAKARRSAAAMVPVRPAAAAHSPRRRRPVLGARRGGAAAGGGALPGVQGRSVLPLPAGGARGPQAASAPLGAAEGKLRL